LGELDVAITHSFLVVLAGWVSQSVPSLSPLPWLLALPLGLSVLPAIILAGFPDFEADATAGKRTLVVRLGRHRAAVVAGVCALCAAVAPLFAAGSSWSWISWSALPAIPHAMWLSSKLRRYLDSHSPPGRIDGLLITALTFMLWFCIVPLVVLLTKKH
jgi:1,4-dihydroxy-2-naphthoate octaprenyltransferase